MTFLIFASWLKTSRLLGEIGKEKYDIMNDENAQKVFIYVYIHIHTYIVSKKQKLKRGSSTSFQQFLRLASEMICS